MSNIALSEARIALVFEKFSSFVEEYGSNLSMGGMFLETDDRRPVGSIVDFEIKLKDGFRLIQGLGQVLWVRPRTVSADRQAGMGVRFQALDDQGRDLILKILEERVRAGVERFDVEEVPEDLRGGSEAQPAVVSEPPLSEPPLSEPPVPAAPGSRSGARAELLDVEQKILGEDGFTLRDGAAAKTTPAAAPQAAEGLQEFDAPWGEHLPELPREVLEEDLEAAPAAPGGTAQEADAATAEPPAFLPEVGFGAPEPVRAPSPEPARAPSPEPARAPSPEPVRAPSPEPVLAPSPELDSAIVEAEAASADAGLGGSAREDSMDSSLFMAAEAADEIDLAPAGEDLAEPDFAEIDFGGPSESGEDRQTDSLESVDPGDFVFEPAPEDQLPPLDLAPAEDASGDDTLADFAGDEDPTIVGSSVAAQEEEPTVLTSKPLASTLGFETPGEDSGPSPVAAADEAPGWPPEPVVPGSFQESAPPVSPAGSGDAPIWAPEGDEPLAPVKEQDTGGFEIFAGAGKPDSGAATMSGGDTGTPELPLPVAAPPAGAGAGSATPSGAATVTVAGAPVTVQDYEDDLFAEESGAGSFQVARQALSGKYLVVVVLVLALAAAAYFFRGPLAELAGLGGPAADAPPRTIGERAAAVEPEDASPPVEPAPPPASEAGAAATEVDTPTGGDTTGIVEVVDVSENLPRGDEVIDDPEAEAGKQPPAIEATPPGLERRATTVAPRGSPASRVEEIAWSRSNAGTLVTIRMDGVLAEDRYLHMPLPYDSAKEMIKIIGMDEPYLSGRLEVGLPAIERIRTGLHAGTGEAVIHVVFDYPSPGPRIDEVTNLGDRLEILIVGGAE